MHLPTLDASAVAAAGWRALGIDRRAAPLEAALEPTSVKVMGAYDDPNGSHITIECVSPKFEARRQSLSGY